jgi:hypothetical protein
MKLSLQLKFFLLLAGISTSTVSLAQNLPDLIPFRKGNKWGYCDSTGKLVIEPKYMQAKPFFGNVACVMLGWKYALINKKGEAITPFQYSEIKFDRYDSVAVVSLDKGDKNSGLGLLMPDGKALTPFKYDGIGMFVNGFASVFLGEKEGFINRKGKEVIPPKYFTSAPLLIGNFYEGLCAVSQGQSWWFIDSTGKQVVPGYFESVFPDDRFCNGVCRIHKDGEPYFINRKGKKVSYDEKKYEREVRRSDSLFFAKHEPQPDPGSPRPTLDSTNSWFDGQGKEKHVFVNFYWPDGKLAFTNDYGFGSFFFSGRAKMFSNGKVGFIDVKGNVVIPFKYDYTEKFENGLCEVWVNTGSNSRSFVGYIDIYGREYWEGNW